MFESSFLGPRSIRYGRTEVLKAYYATLWWGWWVFLLCHFNGVPVEWNWQWKTEVLGRKTCPSATNFTRNPTWTDPGKNQGLRGERPATNHLSHGTAVFVTYIEYSTLYKFQFLNSVLSQNKWLLVMHIIHISVRSKFYLLKCFP
jgi:hypothetical protein